MSFDDLISRVLTNEGGYSNNPVDPGGETNWGVTIGFARANGYTGAMKDMTRAQAIELYRGGFWNQIHADSLPAVIQFQALDFAVNSGPDTAIRKLQFAAGVADDGRWGPVTQAAIAAIDKAQLADLYIAERLDFMRKLKAWPSFGAGWAGRIAADLRYAATDLRGASNG